MDFISIIDSVFFIKIRTCFVRLFYHAMPVQFNHSKPVSIWQENSCFNRNYQEGLLKHVKFKILTLITLQNLNGDLSQIFVGNISQSLIFKNILWTRKLTCFLKLSIYDNGLDQNVLKISFVNPYLRIFFHLTNCPLPLIVILFLGVTN